jgi:threonine/homoserine/homoserine lactone efflux protein
MIFDFLLKGFLIGLFASMPVGPIAMLCIQRTLNKGFWHGVFTGLGSAFSDVIYALTAALGMSFIVSFITSKHFFIQIIGSFVIFFFGIYLYRSNPVKSITPVSTPQNYLQDFVTSFFLTLSNPTIIFLFIGLFARFNFIDTEISLFKTAIGMLAVLVGAFSWWTLLSGFVNLFRKKINVRNLWIKNRLMGGIIASIGFLGFLFTIFGISIL